MNPRCRHVWRWWLSAVLVSFAYAELRADRCKCHPTLSRELHAWTHAHRCRWSPLIFAIGGGLLSWHIASLKELSDEVAIKNANR